MTTARPAAPADLPDLVRMIRALAAHHGDASGIDEASLAGLAFGPHPAVTLLVAGEPGHLRGYAALVPLLRLQFGQRGADLHHLWVEPQHRRQGIGKALIAQACATAQAGGAAYLTVGTHPDNHQAQALYPRLGFQPASPHGPRFFRLLDGPGQ
jgi:ribosomal protein S18 acetylase RimI-like enzyme